MRHHRKKFHRVLDEIKKDDSEMESRRQNKLDELVNLKISEFEKFENQMK